MDAVTPASDNHSHLNNSQIGTDMATTIDTNSNTFDVVLNLINDGLAYREAGSVDTNGVYTAIVIMNDDTDDTYGFEVNNYGQHVMYRFDTTDEAEQWQDAVTIDDSPA